MPEMRQHERRHQEIQSLLLQEMLQGSGSSDKIQEIKVKKMRHDLLSDAMFVINQAENIGKSDCVVPNSKLVKSVLEVIRNAGYIEGFQASENSRTLTVQLLGKMNMSRSVKPRFVVKNKEYEKWENRYLPADKFGILIISTSKGVMNQEDAKKLNIGGRLLAYVY